MFEATDPEVLAWYLKNYGLSIPSLECLMKKAPSFAFIETNNRSWNAWSASL